MNLAATGDDRFNANPLGLRAGRREGRIVVDLEKLKPGDCVVSLYHDPLHIVQPNRVVFSAGTPFRLAVPAVDWSSLLVRVTHENHPGRVFLVDKSFIRVAEAAPEPASTTCVCDTFKLMAAGCRCGAMERERAAS